MAQRIVQTSDMVWLLDPAEPMLGPVADKGLIVARVSPGCWGPMITPDYPSGHEVTRPVAVEGAEVGDAVALKIRKIRVLSLATTSGTDRFVEDNFVGDPFVAKRCPNCGTVNPETYVEGIGPDAIRCKVCGHPVHPFELANGYTMLFDDDRSVGVTVPPEVGYEIARQAAEFSALPRESRQYSANLLAKGDIPGTVARVRPMIGNIGSCPAVPMPSSHNAGDFGSFLVGAPHQYALTQEELLKRTDGHMDVNEVREGTVVLVPVKVTGAGIYIGDVHAMMGDGEIAGHTTDVSAEVIIEVEVIKGLELDGPVLLPHLEDLPYLARPYTATEVDRARKVASVYGFEVHTEMLPIQVLGSAPNLNDAVTNALERASRLTGWPVAEVKNRATITGAVDIGRLPGVVQLSLLVPKNKLESLGILHLVQEQYGNQS